MFFFPDPPQLAPNSPDDAQTLAMSRYDAARRLVDKDYCSRLACGVIQQQEAGTERTQACGLAYPMSPQAWCSDACSPYLTELRSRYGQTICGGTITPPPAPSLAENPLPTIVQPSPSVPVQALPAPLRPTATTMIDEVTCPSCQTGGCAVKLGDCCLSPLHLVVLAAILYMGVSR